jgi:hypothetical protein
LGRIKGSAAKGSVAGSGKTSRCGGYGALGKIGLDEDSFEIFSDHVEDKSPQFPLNYLNRAVHNGATVVVFLNPIHDGIKIQRGLYTWIPSIPTLDFTHDKLIYPNDFRSYPDMKYEFLAPILAEDVDLPVLLRVTTPANQETIHLFANANGDSLGCLIPLGNGFLLVLPKFISNEDVIETFLHRVVPKMYDLQHKSGLVEMFVSPVEQERLKQLAQLEKASAQIAEGLASERVGLETARREKANTISKDPTARRVLAYYDTAKLNEESALFYLYKMIEAIENKYGGEANGIKAVGASEEWKFVKRLANKSYADVRHAPKPTEIIEKPSRDEIEAAFKNTEKVVLAYFRTLF